MDYSKHICAKPCGGNEIGMKFQIHCIEKEAYGSVLRAFIAQSDLLSWAKEGLITELRKELHVTDTEHGELLGEINSDESIKMLREWRKGNPYVQDSVNTPGSVPNSMGNALWKVRKSYSFVLKSQKQDSHGQTSSAVFPSFMPVQIRNEQIGCEGAIFSSRKSPHSMPEVSHDNQVLPSGKGRVPAKSQPMMTSDGPYSGDIKERTDFIQIRATEKLIHEVEMLVRGRKCSDPAVEKAKLILRAHEKSILEALAKLSKVSADDASPNQMMPDYLHELHGNKHQKVTHGGFPGLADRSHCYHAMKFRYKLTPAN